MGMTIDKAIKLMIRGSKYDYDGTPEEFCEAYDMSIEIMRKYKKICEILDKSDNGEQCMYDTIQEIEEVRDGMTIEENAIKTLNEIIDEGWLISDMEKCTAIDACEFAIDRIRKYQEIEQIIKDHDNDRMPEDYWYIDRIREVLEDGKT